MLDFAVQKIKASQKDSTGRKLRICSDYVPILVSFPALGGRQYGVMLLKVSVSELHLVFVQTRVAPAGRSTFVDLATWSSCARPTSPLHMLTKAVYSSKTNKQPMEAQPFPFRVAFFEALSCVKTCALSWSVY